MKKLCATLLLLSVIVFSTTPPIGDVIVTSVIHFDER